jgi:hypothetical protein
MNSLKFFNDFARFNDWLNDLTEEEKTVILQMLEEAYDEGYREGLDR